LTKEDVRRKAEEAKNIRFGDYPSGISYLSGKGGIGHLLEEKHFGYRANSRPEPDFKEAGVELKVTPYRVGPNATYTSKERLVLNIIDYMKEAKATFETSSFWTKNKRLMILFYEHRDQVPIADWFISFTLLYEFPEVDLIIIRDDWRRIIETIRAGKAHELTESATLYLGACTKAAKATNTRPQPYSPIPAKPRAYCLKQPFMTYLLRNRVLKIEDEEKIVKNAGELQESTFESYMYSRIAPYIGWTQERLIAEFLTAEAGSRPVGSIQLPKNINEILIARIFGLKGRVSKTAEFMKAGIIPKTIQLEPDGQHVRESMSFPVFHFIDLVDEEWESSGLKEMFDTTRFFFIVFRKQEVGTPTLEGAFFWNMPASDLGQVREVWKKTKNIAIKGVEVSEVGGRQRNNLPKASENRVSHVRPHGRDGDDTDTLPDGSTITKQCFWLNNTYIAALIAEWKDTKE